MARDPETIAHQEWLGYVQPVGLVVSIPALLNAQAYINRNIVPDHQRFMSCLPKDKDENPIPEIRDFADYCHTVFDWRLTDLERFVDDDDKFGALQVTLPEYHETLRPTHVIREPEPKDPKHPWMMLIQVLSAGHDLDTVVTVDHRNWQATPQAKFERLLRETRMPLGLLCNGRQIRMVYAPRGETSGYITFGVPEMAQVAGRPIFAGLHMLLCEPRLFSLGEKQRLPAILADSRKYQNTVSTKLAEQVLAALYELVRGFQAANERGGGELLRSVLAEDSNHVYNGLLTVLMRLVFILFAEDRGLISNDSVYTNFYSLTGLFERLRADDGRYPDTMNLRYGAWAQLLTLFRLIYEGGSHGGLKIPPRHGYLFDPDRYNFLEGRPWDKRRDEYDGVAPIPHVSDGVVFRVLNNLLILDGERLSYRTLDVEQIGSVYEVTMGFGLGVATGSTIAIKPKKSLAHPVPIDLDELLLVPGAERAKWLKTNTDQEVSGEAATALKAAGNITDLLAALARRIAVSATPSPIPKGGMVPIPSDERRRSGSNYTPRSLTRPIVETTLRPVLQPLGDNPTPDQILDLKVCDPAMGSGAFLVEACRQIGDQLVKSWQNHKQVPILPPDEDEILHARRLIAQRCLYGVDRNPMAVDLAKLSLWLATLAKDHPFTFLDHNFRCGDSLVGLARAQIEGVHWSPKGWQTDIRRMLNECMEQVSAQRREILSAGDDVPFETKREQLNKADDTLSLPRLAGDCVVAAFFSATKDTERETVRRRSAGDMDAWLLKADSVACERLHQAAESLRAGHRPIHPFHWVIEFPEVFDRKSGGFDAMVGNPPFAGRTTLSEGSHINYIEWLQVVHDESHGNADLVAHFFRRTFSLLRDSGAFGLIATNTIGQGDTRFTGLRWLCTHGGTIVAARKRVKWPGAAAVVVSIVHVQKSGAVALAELDGREVPQITAYLLPMGGHESPEALRANRGICFQGAVIVGMGFTFDDTDTKGIANPIAVMDALLEREPSYAERIRPYIGGEELLDSPQQLPHRWVMNLSDLEEADAWREWPELMRLAERKVKPQRISGATASSVDKKKRAEKWWQFSRSAKDLRDTVAGMKRVLALSRVGQHCASTFVPADMVFSEMCVVFALDRFSQFCAIQSRVHEFWVRRESSSMKDDLRYAPTDCFQTFPLPRGFVSDARLESEGRLYYDHRAALMLKNNEGLTKTYNRFHDPNEQSPGILRLRELHAAMDRAVLDAYGWTDIPTDCQFLLDYEDEEQDTDTPSSGRGRKKPWRYRWPDEIRDEVLARLLEENKKQAERERLAGLSAADAKPPGSKRRKAKLNPAKWELDPPSPVQLTLPGLSRGDETTDQQDE